MRSTFWQDRPSISKPERSPVRSLSGLSLARSGWRAALCVALILGLAWAGGGGLHARAAANATLTVNNTGDVVDINPGDGVCETASGNGVCTLRAAIQEANALAGADTITLPAGTYLLTLVGTDDTAAAGDLDITGDLTLNGAGSATTIIDANGVVTGDRAFHVFNSVFNLAGVTVQNGRAAEGGAIYNNMGSLVISNSVFTANQAVSAAAVTVRGGAIYTYGALTVSDSTFSQNQATASSEEARGGAVYVVNQLPASFTNVDFIQNLVKSGPGKYGAGGAVFSLHKLTVSYGTFLENQALNFDPANTLHAQGGAIAISGTGSLELTETFFQQNISQGYGGSVYLGGGQMIAHNPSMTANQAYRGGAIYIASFTQAYLDRGVWTGNTVTSNGGAIYSEGDLTIDKSTITQNQAVSYGGGIYNLGKLIVGGASITSNTVSDPSSDNEYGGGIASGGSQPVLIYQSAIESNQAYGGGGIQHNGTYTMTIVQSSIRLNKATQGGGIIAYYPLVIRQSTFSGNTAYGDGGALRIQVTKTHIVNSTISSNSANGSGGGIDNLDGKLYLSNATITLNTADADASGSGEGGGYKASATGTVTLRNSVIAGNNDASPAGNQPEDCQAVLTSGGYNLLGINYACTGLTNGVNGDLVGTLAAPLNAQLASLAQNGGPTRTHLPLAGSPLIDAGNPAGCFDYQGFWLIFDQRGYQRPVDGNANAVAVCDIGATEYLAVLAKLFYLPFLLRP